MLFPRISHFLRYSAKSIRARCFSPFICLFLIKYNIFCFFFYFHASNDLLSYFAFKNENCCYLCRFYHKRVFKEVLYNCSAHRSAHLFRTILKALRQISKKQCFEKYCSCDQVRQFSASQGTPWRSYFENLAIDGKFINKRFRLFTHQTMCRDEKIISTFMEV